jgi:hypothetical protein
MTSNSPDDAELSFNASPSYGGYSDVAGPTYSGHYDQQLSYHADSSPGMFNFCTAESDFLSPIDPSPNSVWCDDSNWDSPATMPSTNYYQDLSP